MTTTSVPDLSARRPPALGGFNLTALSLEIRRLRRNPRAVIITVIVPVIFFFAFGLNKTNTTGKILFNQSGNSKDSTVTAVRIN